MPRAIQAISDNRNKFGPGCLVAFFSVFLLAGLGFGWFVGIRPAWRIHQAGQWPAAPCRILSSKVKSNSSSDGTTYSVAITFAYQYGGRDYTSDQYSFFTGSSSGRSGKAKVVAAHPPGRQTVCYVNPNDPQEAVLNRRYTSEIWFVLIPLVFVAVGGGGVWYAVRVVLKARKPLSPQFGGGFDGVSQQADYLPEYRAGDGPVTLKPRQPRWLKLIGMILVAAFWNGIVSVFVLQVVEGFQTDRPDWFLTIFMIPFVVIGAGLIGAIFYFALALFNPKPILTVNREAVPLGETLDLAWNMAGRAYRMRQLSVFLEGREHATYQRGTDTVTDEHTFTELLLFDTSDKLAMAQGSASITIPNDTMHSFVASNNKIVWSIRFHGDVPRWPDVKQRFAIVILPQTGATQS
jgi:hypothetical protein